MAAATMSLDGYIATADNGIGHLFDWYDVGPVTVPTVTPGLTFHLTETSAGYWQRWTSQLGALVCGRVLFDVTDGWNGRHTMDVPVVVVTHRRPDDWIAAHPDAPFTFVTDGIRAAVEQAQALAGDRIVAVAAGTVATQCLDLGLLDEVAVDLVPVVLGGGRPFFGELRHRDVLLGDPTTCIRAERVTHLVFPVTQPPR
ncbi:deaminase [Nakamurella endophytica]|uniref:Deaminase n=1 Tax=Nakamurella endophytica TaxID=1748367 RepID=A0A917WLN8_9ACTN|nr:deaminase [Nakamurella endophytica]